jgi:hypothetical protein
MSTVKVTFKYEPDSPDEEDDTGMTEEEYEQLMDQLAALGGYDVEISKETV